MITLDLSILNQKGTPMFNSDIFANRPAAGIAGRIFISTDTLALFRDTGSTWDPLGGGGGTISGSIAAGQVAFGTAANTIGGNNNLFWNNVNARLGIGTNLPAVFLDVRNSGDLAYYTNAALNAGLIIGNSANLAYITSISSLSALGFGINGGTSAIRIFTSSNIAINSTVDNGARLQVSGDTILTGSGTTAATSALRVNNNSGTLLFELRNDKTVLFSDNSLFAISPSNGNWTWEASLNRNFIISATTRQNAASNSAPFQITGNFSPTSGSNLQNFILLTPAVSQTGGANGITRGIYLNPTLSAFDWRSIQWDNNTGWGLYGAGTAANYFGGNVQIGSTTPIASTIKLQVTGSAAIQDTSTYTSGTIQSFVTVKNVTINTGISGSSGICNYVSTGDNTIQSSQSVPASTSYAGIYQYNKYAFASAGLTLTATQAAGNGLRSVSQLQTQNVFKGANNGTITHVSGIQIAGFYNENNTTITPIITNAYQLVINDTGAYGHTFSFTNRWGIYQEGINDRNYLAGNLLLNSTVDTGQILQINGAIRVNGQASGTAGGASGQHLIINVDGTQYKIALLNP